MYEVVFFCAIIKGVVGHFLLTSQPQQLLKLLYRNQIFSYVGYIYMFIRWRRNKMNELCKLMQGLRCIMIYVKP